MKRSLTIILRTCGTVESLHGTRYINRPKSEIINVCLSSLVDSINNTVGHDIELVVIDDHSSTTVVDDIKTILGQCKVPAEFIALDGGTGNWYSMEKVYQLVESRATDLWYHVEDDYLHYPTAVQDMLDSVNQLEQLTGQMVAINPHDDVWRYKQEIYPSYILHGPYRHYRSVKHTTYTCLASKAIYNKYKNHFTDVVALTKQRADWVENKSINLVWNKNDVALFSPIPSLALHLMDESGKDPYIDVDGLWYSVPELWKRGDPSRYAIVSMFNEPHYELAEHTWYNNKVDYAAKHGYKAIAKTAHFSSEAVHFDKFVHILHTLNKNPDLAWVWWLDNDAMITNYDRRIEDIIDDSYDIIIATDLASINTGSFFVKNSENSRVWLEDMISKRKDYINDKKWFDQQCVIDTYVTYQDIIKIIPQKLINCYDYRMYNAGPNDMLGINGQWEQGDWVVHWPGLNNSLRIQLAKEFAKIVAF